MDRIRKALDLARLQRGAPEMGFERHAARLEPLETLPSEPARSGERASSGPPSTIVYSRTKTFEPDARHLDRNRVVNPATDRAGGAYRMLRTQVLQRMDEHGWRSIAVFSPTAEDGKTTTAINLAIGLAGDHRHTALLVDFDFKRTQVAACLGLSPEFGVDDVLLGRAPLEDCMYHPVGFDRLVVLPARARLDHSSDIISGSTGRALVAELRARYPERVIVFDLPPVLNADDALSFAPLVECGLVVAAEGRTRRNDLVRTIELLSKTPLVGTVLNRAADAPAGY
jgi:protein-tyrosine kinase